MRTLRISRNKLWAIVIGVGLALSPIHNLWLTQIATNSEGVTYLFIPQLGALIWIMAALLYLTWNWDWKSPNWGFGDKRVFIPMLVIVVAMGISGITATTIQSKVAPFLMGIALFAVYLTAFRLGSDIFLAIIPFVVIGVVVAIVSGIINPGISSGGLITNYCASAGFLIFGALVNQGKWQWLLVVVALIGVFFIGALEAVFIVGVLGIAVLARRDVSRKFLIAGGVLLGLVGLWAALGYLTPLYEGNFNLLILGNLLSGKVGLTFETLWGITSGRWEIWLEALQDIKLIGHGYSLSLVGGRNVHNLPLIIMHQIGPIGAVAWSFVTVYCLIRTKWKYAWIGLIAMCVFDHYIWTQFMPYWWALVGVSLASPIKSDLIFKKGEVDKDVATMHKKVVLGKAPVKHREGCFKIIIGDGRRKNHHEIQLID